MIERIYRSEFYRSLFSSKNGYRWWLRTLSLSLSRVSEILKSLCNDFLPKNVSAILYLMNYETYGRSTASAQYFLQLAGYLGIPVIAWNADNSGLERVSGCKCSFFFPFYRMWKKEEEEEETYFELSSKNKSFLLNFRIEFLSRYRRSVRLFRSHLRRCLYISWFRRILAFCYFFVSFINFNVPLKFSLVEVNSTSYYSIVMANDRCCMWSISCFLDESTSSSHNIQFSKRKNLRSIQFIHKCDSYFIHFMRDCLFWFRFPLFE